MIALMMNLKGLGLFAIGVSLALLATTVQAAADPPPQEVAPVDMAAAPTDILDPAVQQMNAVLEDVVNLEGFSEASAGFVVGEDQASLTVLVVDSSPQAELFRHKIDEAVQGRVQLRFESRKHSEQELREFATRLIEDTDLNARTLGGIPSAVEIDVKSGTLRVSMGTPLNRSASTPDLATELGVPVTVNSQPTSLDLQATSVNDDSPWSGGGRIFPAVASPATYCTSGFVWDKWTTREKLGSSAEHCYVGTKVVSWKTGPAVSTAAAYVEGTRVSTMADASADTFLMRARSGTSFQPYVWIAGKASPSAVKGYLLSTPVDGVVALSGATSGYHSTKVRTYATFATTDAQNSPKAVYAAVTYSNTCDGGDSGGPWLTAYGNLTIRAHGQHMGEWMNDYNGASLGCVFVQVGTISAALKASIAIA